jgi:Xaa-Pro aminopeptidase
MGAEHRERLARLRARLSQADLQGLVVSAPSNVFYLSGFTGSAGVLMVTAERAALFSDFRYRLQSREQAPDYEFVEAPRQLLARVGEEAKAAGVARLGCDPAHLTCDGRDQLAGGAEGVEIFSARGMVEDLRAVKSPEEVNRIRAAAALADQALSCMIPLLRAGAKERDVALEGEFLMRRAGAEAVSFDLIVASGPRSALPHAETTERELQRGDLVVIDIGAKVDGYCSDMTRTFAVGAASEEARGIYDVVYRAQRASAAAVRAGALCGEVDRVARSLIEQAGYGDLFGHGLGHGVGVEVHEAPRLGKDEQAALTAGNVVTVEPGIYVPEVGGVRLEDLLLVREADGQTLTGSPMAPELPVV